MNEFKGSSGAVVTVSHEGLSVRSVGGGTRIEIRNPSILTALSEYFLAVRDGTVEAHPEPKPWHLAKPGEIWRLTITDRWITSAGLIFHVIGDKHGRFARPQISGKQMEYDLTAPQITAGRRIWPEAD